MAKNLDFHEDFRRKEEVKGSSNRGFGIVFAVFFAILTFSPLTHGDEIRWKWFGIPAVAFLAAAAWLFGAWPFMAATLGAMAILLWRQRRSPAAGAIADLRKALEDR